MIKDAIKRAMIKRIKRGYNYTYWLIDIHDTIIPSTYSYPNKYDINKYPYMLETLQLLSEMDDMKLILWSCTPKEHITELVSILNENDINIDYFNENPECKPKDIQDFSGKFFSDLIIDDKAGFNADYDWEEIFEHLCIIKTHGLENYIQMNIL